MSEYNVTLSWNRSTPDFNYKTYDRTHTVTFAGGIAVETSAAPEYLGKAELANPEEFFLAALSSCHMLTFLAMAAMKGYTVDSYRDDPIAQLAKNTQGRIAVTQVTLKPTIIFSGDKQPDAEALHQLHEKAHENCFIAHSVTTKIDII